MLPTFDLRQARREQYQRLRKADRSPIESLGLAYSVRYDLPSEPRMRLFHKKAGEYHEIPVPLTQKERNERAGVLWSIRKGWLAAAKRRIVWTDPRWCCSDGARDRFAYAAVADGLQRLAAASGLTAR